jgi:hypothetical protein
VDRFGNVLELGVAEVGDLEVEPTLHLPVGLLGKTDRARLGDAFQSRGDVDPVAHEVAVFLFDHVAEVDADAILVAEARRCVRLTRSGLQWRSALRRQRSETQ